MSQIPTYWRGMCLQTMHPYRNSLGIVLGYVVRYQAGKDKATIPYFYKDDKLVNKAPDSPRPLYNPPGMINPAVPILVVEGEKCVDAVLTSGLPFWPVTSMNGSASASKADWASLSGRESIYILPDNDSAGIKYRDAVAQELFKLLIPPRNIYLCSPLGDSDGFDIADAIDTMDRFAIAQHISEKNEFAVRKLIAPPTISVNRERFTKAAQEVVGISEFYSHEFGVSLANAKTWVNIPSLCPFHADKQSGTFRAHLGIGCFICFSCGAKGGNIFSFYSMKYGVSYGEAVESILRRHRT